MNAIVKVLMERDNMDEKSAKEYVDDAKEQFYIESAYDDFDLDDFMADWFGLEPDYIFDLMWGDLYGRQKFIWDLQKTVTW